MNNKKDHPYVYIFKCVDVKSGIEGKCVYKFGRGNVTDRKVEHVSTYGNVQLIISYNALTGEISKLAEKLFREVCKNRGIMYNDFEDEQGKIRRELFIINCFDIEKYKKVLAQCVAISTRYVALTFGGYIYTDIAEYLYKNYEDEFE